MYRQGSFSFTHLFVVISFREFDAPFQIEKIQSPPALNKFLQGLVNELFFGLGPAQLEPVEQVDARKATLKEKDALQLIQGINKVYAAKGKQVICLDLRKEKPTREMLKKVLLGPTGNLRAPTLRKGKTLIVGFDQATYEQLLAGR